MEDAVLRSTFDKDALLYDQARPSYPKELFEKLIKKTAIDKDSELLEIGPGTGQATLPLAEHGYKILAVELGSKLAELFRYKFTNYPNIKITTGAFEDINLPVHSFDLIYSATAFHWIMPEFRFKKTYDLLKPRGHLAIIHTNHVSDKKGNDFFDATQPIYNKYFPSNKNSKFRIPHQDGVKPEGIDTTLFELTYLKFFPMVVDYNAESYAQLLGTISLNQALPPGKRERFLSEIKDLISNKFNGHITKTYAMSLTTARKIKILN